MPKKAVGESHVSACVVHHTQATIHTLEHEFSTACTHTHECGYGFHVGVGTGRHDVTHGLPMMNTRAGGAGGAVRAGMAIFVRNWQWPMPATPAQPASQSHVILLMPIQVVTHSQLQLSHSPYHTHMSIIRR